MGSQTAKWVAVDWGHSNFRAWIYDRGDRLIDLIKSETGTRALKPTEFESALVDAIGPYLGDAKTQVVCCGMVGGDHGWQKTPYAKVPCEPANVGEALLAATNDPRLEVYILPGVSQENPADVMRGEETQISGFLADNPKFDGVLCLPSAHTKWAHISAGEVVSFRTFMTGEMFSVMSKHSILSQSVQDKGWDDIEFENSVSDGMSSPQLVGARLFGLRAEGLLKNLSPATAKARLSGLLIGLELAGSRPYWLGQNIAIIGEPTLSALYAAALRVQDAPAELVGGDRMTETGLKSAYNQLFGHEVSS